LILVKSNREEAIKLPAHRQLFPVDSVLEARIQAASKTCPINEIPRLQFKRQDVPNEIAP
jgi:hypothetical protein